MFPVIVSFYTKDWEYPAHAKRLKKELDSLQIPHDIVERPSAGGYLQNTCQKPFFIREMLLKHKEPILWVDVDASVFRRPHWFCGLDADISLRPKPPTHRRKWHVGTMWFNYNKVALEFIDEWCKLTGDLSDESALEQLWQAGTNAYIIDMPYEFHEIEMGAYKPSGRTCIMHRLSSGQSKREQRHIFKGEK